MRKLLLISGVAAALAAPSVGRAQSTNAHPDLATSVKATDPADLPVTTEVRTAASSYLDYIKKNGGFFVLAVGADQKTWAAALSLAGVPFSVAEIARTALERCGYAYKGACILLSINGRDTRLPGGGWAQQPMMLARNSSDFDTATVPFITDYDRASLTTYAGLAGNRALVITTFGNWLYRSGDTPQKAIDTAMNDCHASFKSDNCLLYAVNNHVVFDAY